MTENTETLVGQLEAAFGERVARIHVPAGQITLEVEPSNLLSVATELRDAFHFEQMTDLCAVDYSEYGRADWRTSDAATRSGYSRGVERGEHQHGSLSGPRFAVVYHLLSISKNQRVRVRTPSPGEPPAVPSVVDIWAGADWFEREAFDLFGVLFSGHPDLRRILTDYGFVGHPFRKDFPLIGHVEMRYDPARERVIYEPVQTEPRTLVPRVIRNDQRYTKDEVKNGLVEEPTGDGGDNG